MDFFSIFSLGIYIKDQNRVLVPFSIVFGKILKDLKAVFYLSAFNDRGAKETPILYSETERRNLGTYSIINL